MKALFSIDDDEVPSYFDRHHSGKGGGADLDLATSVLRRTTKGRIMFSVFFGVSGEVTQVYFVSSRRFNC